jgi:predicted ester cyclase
MRARRRTRPIGRTIAAGSRAFESESRRRADRATLTRMNPAHGEPLNQRRERIVSAHIDAERRGDWSAALSTFHLPRYEIMATGEVHDGETAVMAFYRESAAGLLDIDFETRGLFHTADAVVHELVFSATHGGPWRGLPPTDKRVRYPMLNLFLFDGDRLICERMYFDLSTPLRQLGIARDPTSRSGRLAIALNHPLVVGRAWLRGALRSPRPFVP